MTVEYRLAVSPGTGPVRHYAKRDLGHALKGLADAYRDFEKAAGVKEREPSAWVETRSVSPWHPIVDNEDSDDILDT